MAWTLQDIIDPILHFNVNPLFHVVQGLLVQIAFHYFKVSMLGRVTGLLVTLLTLAVFYKVIPRTPKKDMSDPQVGLILTVTFTCLSVEFWLEDWLSVSNTLFLSLMVFIAVANPWNWDHNGRPKEEVKEETVENDMLD